jgi:hypothetical protein
MQPAAQQKRGNVKNLTNAGKGRPKGTPNKATAQVKEMVIEALSKAGGVEYLTKQAKDNPAAFMTLVGKVIPLQVAGDAVNPIRTVTRIEIVGVMP